MTEKSQRAVSSRWGLLLALIASLSSAPAAAQSGEDHVVMRPGPREGPLWLGITARDALEHVGDGVEVTGVLRRTPADGSGVRVGDRIVGVEGKEVSSLAELRRLVSTHAKGDKVDVEVVRGTKHETLKFVLAPRPNNGEEIIRNHLLGYPAPEFSFRFVGDGKDVHLSELRGKPTVLDFWATWCGPCHKVQGELAAVKEKFGDRINIVGVSDESAKTVRAFLKRFPAKYAMAVDERGDSRTDYIVETIPQIVILDADHKVAAVIFGANNQELIEKKLANILRN